jgi:hypothetical protein
MSELTEKNKFRNQQNKKMKDATIDQINKSRGRRGLPSLPKSYSEYVVLPKGKKA